MFCERCGAEVTDGARFCGRCGHRVAGDIRETTGGEAEPAAPDSLRAAQAAVTSGPSYAQEAKVVWSRVGSPELAAAGILAALGLLLALVGLIATLSGSGFDLGKQHGLLWGSLGGALALTAVGWSFAAAVRFQDGRSWSVARDRTAAYILAGVGLVLGLIGLIASHGDDLSSAQPNGSAWFLLAGVIVFICFGALVLARPLEPSRGFLGAIALGSLGLLLAVVGLAVGLGEEPKDVVRGAGWLTSASLLAFLGVAALLGRR